VPGYRNAEPPCGQSDVKAPVFRSTKDKGFRAPFRRPCGWLAFRPDLARDGAGDDLTGAGCPWRGRKGKASPREGISSTRLPVARAVPRRPGNPACRSVSLSKTPAVLMMDPRLAPRRPKNPRGLTLRVNAPCTRATDGRHAKKTRGGILDRAPPGGPAFEKMSRAVGCGASSITGRADARCHQRLACGRVVHPPVGGWVAFDGDGAGPRWSAAFGARGRVQQTLRRAAAARLR
jgi:hypothetical protein